MVEPTEGEGIDGWIGWIVIGGLEGNETKASVDVDGRYVE